MLRVGPFLAIFALAIGQSATAEQFRAATPTLRAVVAADSYEATTPTLRMTVTSGGFAATTPTLTARASGLSYSATTPTLTAIASIDSFQATTPTLSAITSPEAFRATTPALKAVVLSDGFRATTPELRVVALREPEDTSEPTEEKLATGPIPGTLSRCDSLLQCFPEEDIVRVEGDLLSLGYTPETYGAFCQDVAQSLGECVAAEGAPGGAAIPGSPTPPPLPDGDISGLNFARCLPLEEYATALQKRSDEGEDTDAEEEQLMLIITAASRHLLNGRADRYCAEVAANLP